MTRGEAPWTAQNAGAVNTLALALRTGTGADSWRWRLLALALPPKHALALALTLALALAPPPPPGVTKPLYGGPSSISSGFRVTRFEPSRELMSMRLRSTRGEKIAS